MCLAVELDVRRTEPHVDDVKATRNDVKAQLAPAHTHRIATENFEGLVLRGRDIFWDATGLTSLAVEPRSRGNGGVISLVNTAICDWQNYKSRLQSRNSPARHGRQRVAQRLLGHRVHELRGWESH